MKKTSRTERILFLSAIAVFAVLMMVLLLLLLRGGGRTGELPGDPAASQTPDETPPADPVTICGKAVDKNTDTFYLNNVTLTDEDKEKIRALPRVTTLSLTNCGLYDAAFLGEMRGLTTLYLSGNSITDLTPLGALSELRTLYLDGNPVADLTPLTSLSALTTLSLKDVPIADYLVEDFREAMPGCHVFDDGAVDAARPLTLGGLEFTEDATSLDLSGRGITDITRLIYCKKLVELNLAGNPLDSVATLKELPELQVLNLSGTGLEDSDLKVLMGIRHLTRLDIRGNGALTADGLDVLKEGLTDCEILHDELYYKVELGGETITSNLSELSLPERGISDISPLKKFKDLTGLNMPSNQISDLSPLRNNVHLRMINLENNRITSVEGLYGMTELETLDLSDNAIEDITALASCTALKTLDLSNNRLSYVSHLALCTRLEWLDLRGNPDITADTIEYLRLLLPNCQILTDVVINTPEPVPTPPPEPTYAPDPTAPPVDPDPMAPGQS